MSLIEELAKKPIPKDLAFSEDEYRRRLAMVRRRMAQAGLDALLVSSVPNVCYLTGYETVVPSAYIIAVVPLKGEVLLHLSTWEVPCAMLTSWVTDLAVIPWHNVDKASHLAEVLKARGLGNKRIGIEAGKPTTYTTGAMDVRTYLRLTESLPEATFEDATYLVTDVRLIKSEAELACMRKAGEITFKGLQASIAEVAPGKTDNDVVAAGYAVMTSAGSELMSIDPMIQSGPRAGWGPHVTYRRVPLRVGDAVYLNYSGCYHRYNAPTMRTVSIGEPADDIRRLAEASISTLELVIENIRAGRTAHEVAVAAKKGLAPVQDTAFFHGTFSYAVGLSFPPQWSEGPMYIQEGSDRVLEAGMTLHLPIHLFVPGRYGVGFSETVAVTAGGCEVLTPGKERRLVVCNA